MRPATAAVVVAMAGMILPAISLLWRGKGRRTKERSGEQRVGEGERRGGRGRRVGREMVWEEAKEM